MERWQLSLHLLPSPSLPPAQVPPFCKNEVGNEAPVAGAS